MAPFLATVVLLLGALTSPLEAATLIHSNDVLGEIEPCGCRSNPLGGFARKYNFLGTLKDPSRLQLDAGDLLFPSDSMPELLRDQSEAEARYILKAMDLMKHDAVVPGEKDFALGFRTFERLRKGCHAKFLAANLKRRGGGPYLPAHAIFRLKEKNGKTLSVAVFGIVGEDLPWPKELKATSALAAAKKQVAELRKKADVLIALTHQGLQSDLKLAKAVSGIDYIVGGHTQSFLQTPVKIGKTTIFQSSFRNQYLGILPFEQPSEYHFVGLDPGYVSKPGKPNPVDRLVDEFKDTVAKLSAKHDAAMEKHLATGKEEFQTFPRCAECHLKQFDFWRKTPHALAMGALIAQREAPNKECIACHTLGFGQSKGFLDVYALAQLDDGKSNWSAPEIHAYLKHLHDAAGIETPIPAPGRKGAELPLRQTLPLLSRSWAPVQCENCHAMPANHPFASGLSKKVEKTTCLRCHTPERAPGWYSGKTPDWKTIEAKFQSMSCPAEILTPDE